MNSMGRYVQFKLGFHAFILIVSIGIMASSILGRSELERPILYLILGCLIGIGSIYELVKTVKGKKKNE
ncbi:hypothetical protein [Oceanobacillus halotolerans]|uniref:hypothetical protein n=1 Tax=Oceanobacillus halotolerans TaxID=2663380 RepID=UPI0013DA923B|nr:hypothetical protein [Oceanobacillus halotolerans]